jgi:uncharacterized membrane protein (GlpM family)
MKTNLYTVAIIGFLVVGSWMTLGAVGSASSFSMEDIARGAGMTFLALTYYFAAYVVVQWQKSVTRKDEK